MSILVHAQKLQNMMAEGKTMEAFEELYHDDVQVFEIPTGEHRNGKDAQRKAIEGWFAAVKEVNGGGVNSITANEETAMSSVETWMDVTMQDGSRMKMEEVAIQKWEDGKIIEEKFYYHMPAQPTQEQQKEQEESVQQ